MNALILDLQAELAELAALEAESIGWLPLGDGAYLHIGNQNGGGGFSGAARTQGVMQ